MPKHGPSWACLQPTKESAWHTSASCLCGQALVIIGGTGKEGNAAEVFVYHLHELQWLKADTTGKGPPTRPLYCSATGRGESVAVVWSKQQPGTTKILVTLSVLSLAHMRWHSIPLDGTVSPPRRGYRAATSAQGDILIFGGEGSINEHLPSNTCVLVQDDNTVSLLPREDCPPPRSDHACTVAPQDTIVIHGGKGTGGTLLGDMWVYDAARRTWLEICEGPRRCGHGISATERMIMLFGGVDVDGVVCNDLWVWSVNGHQWRGPIQVGSLLPAPRAGHLFSLVWPVLDDPSPEPTTCFVLYGGVGGPNMPPFHDVYRLSVPTDTTSLPLEDPLDGRVQAPPGAGQLEHGSRHELESIMAPQHLHAPPTHQPLQHLHAPPTHAQPPPRPLPPSQDTEDVEILDAMHRLKTKADALDEQEKELHNMEVTRRNREMQLQLDREKLERDRTQLVKKMHKMDSAIHEFQTNRLPDLPHREVGYARRPEVYDDPLPKQPPMHAHPGHTPVRPHDTHPVHVHPRPTRDMYHQDIQHPPIYADGPRPQPAHTFSAHPAHVPAHAVPVPAPMHSAPLPPAAPAPPAPSPLPLPLQDIQVNRNPQVEFLEKQLAQERHKVQALMGQLTSNRDSLVAPPFAPRAQQVPRASEPPFVVQDATPRHRVVSPPRPVNGQLEQYTHPVR